MDKYISEKTDDVLPEFAASDEEIINITRQLDVAEEVEARREKIFWMIAERTEDSLSSLSENLC